MFYHDMIKRDGPILIRFELLILQIQVCLVQCAGMGFRPMPEDVEKGSLIWYKASNASNVDTWVQSINKFIARK